MKLPAFSIMVPFRGLTNEVLDCVLGCLALNYPADRFEIVLLPDHPLDLPTLGKALDGRATSNDDLAARPAASGLGDRLRILATGPVLPGKKRNLGIATTDAEYIACIDSDAYPEPDWLCNAARVLALDGVGIVGGPNHPSPDATYLERMAVHAVYLKLMVGALYVLSAEEQELRDQSDMSSSNLVIPRTLVMDVGGFAEELFPCEDSVLCYRVVNAGHRIVHARGVAVFHHRRPLFLPHMSNIFSTARTKAIVLPEFSDNRKLMFYLPSLLVLGLGSGPLLAMVDSSIGIAWFAGLTVYMTALIVDAWTCGVRVIDGPVVALGAAATHIAYGSGFLVGFAQRLLGKRFDIAPSGRFG
jgi:hypothetical protein